jgi:four helix bundle protein
MGTVKRFEDLECWQAARELVGFVYLLTRNTPFCKDFELVSQIRRSAVSAMANIAEGFHRKSTRDFLKFLDYSRASVAETVSHGYVALDQGYFAENVMDNLREKTEIVWRKVNGFITYLNKKNA